MTPYLSSIYIFGGNFQIKGFAFCYGQIMAISQNTALFSLLGTTYGGNGTSNFGLPDLRGRTALQQGQGPGLSLYPLGEVAGVENETMLISNMPAHNHRVNANAASGSVQDPTNNYLAEAKEDGPHGQAKLFYNTGPANTVLAPLSVSIAGSSIPFGIQQPVLGLTPLIATSGIFPARN